ncbi:hypothetical protein BD410DRAFT_790494 [Rickenella mellea]|uniref:Carbohydrate esterase family 16 protein n=1 Tax=Rickenella mellea TaxID=50990 RepID=A0A4Y7Q0Q7_9AGAM|nr:hypothetical protein BD410DRAFT_790494 [Rickenella mellea]
MSTPTFTEEIPDAAGPNWLGFASINKLIIFGDSYSSVGYDSKEPAPSAKNPLGVPFPGETYTEGGVEPNWVGHLVTSRKSVSHRLLVYDYAEGGSTIQGVRRQIEREFLPDDGQEAMCAPWDANDTLFVTWVGINDCAYTKKHEKDMERYFGLQEELYEFGARNFMFIDVPPISRTPAMPALLRNEPSAAATYNNWNEHLHKSSLKFQEKHRDAKVFLFSSSATFNRVLDSPEEHGFDVKDLYKRAGKIWMDHLHPTSAMHRWVAKDVEEFLMSKSPATENPAQNAGQID